MGTHFWQVFLYALKDARFICLAYKLLISYRFSTGDVEHHPPWEPRLKTFSGQKKKPAKLGGMGLNNVNTRSTDPITSYSGPHVARVPAES